MHEADRASTRAPATRIPELDGLRGVAVLMVLAWHYVGATIDPTLGLWAKAVARTLILGRTGVDLFFVMSGFLITGIVLDRTRRAGPFVASFYLRRALRIVPPYAMLIAAFWAIVALGASNAAFNADTPPWRHLTFTQNLWMAEHDRWGPDAVSVTWSVAIEEQFYLVFPLLMLMLPRRLVPASLLAIAIASIAWRVVVYTGLGTTFSAYVGTAARLDALALGGVLAWAWRHDAAHAWLAAREAVWRRAVAACLLATPVLAIVIARDLPWHMVRWGHTYLSLLFTTLLLCVLLSSGARWSAVLRSRPLRTIGGISYATYLFHPFMLSCAFLFVGRTEHIRDGLDVMTVIAALAATMAFAVLSGRWVEQPLIRLGRRYAY